MKGKQTKARRRLSLGKDPNPKLYNPEKETLSPMVKQQCTADNRLSTRSFYGSKTAQYMTPLERCQVIVEKNIQIEQLINKPITENVKVLQSKNLVKKKNINTKITKLSKKSIKKESKKTSGKTKVLQSKENISQNRNNSPLSSDSDSEPRTKNKFFKTRQATCRLPERKESSEALLMRERKLIYNKQLSLKNIAQYEGKSVSNDSSGCTNIDHSKSTNTSLLEKVRQSPRIKSTKINPQNSKSTTPKKGCQLSTYLHKIAHSPRFKTDSPRLNKLRAKLKENFDTRDMLETIFHPDYLDNKNTFQPNKMSLKSPVLKLHRCNTTATSQLDLTREKVMSQKTTYDSPSKIYMSPRRSCRTTPSKYRKTDEGCPLKTLTSLEEDQKLYPVFSDNKIIPNSTISIPTQNIEKVPAPVKIFKEKDGKEQLLLDFGQKLTAHTQCGGCGMTYVSGDPLDESTHSNFHHRVINTLKFRGWKSERILQEFNDNERIIMVLPQDTNAKKKINNIKHVIDEELGFVVDKHDMKDTTKIFLYISSKKQIVGFCTAEVIKEAYRVIPGSHNDSPHKLIPEKSIKASPWCCSKTPESALCGINRIWVLQTHRKQGIASKLLDCVRSNFLLGCPLNLSDIAFTDPTPDGRKFASHYCKTTCFLVYKYSHD